MGFSWVLRVRDVAGVAGFVFSLSVALGSVARLFARQTFFSFISFMEGCFTSFFRGVEGVTNLVASCGCF